VAWLLCSGSGSGGHQAILDEHGLAQIDVANFNTPTQTVIAGDKAALAEAAELFAQRTCAAWC
jgi:trans-AT polyketide synthase/acyltransferase/oxidoreductase domain-containing protein